MGISKSLNTYRSSLPISTCTTGIWKLSIGCQVANSNKLILSSSCRHEFVSEVQVVTAIKGICLVSWRTDHRFHRTIILYEKT
ncbi:unnamed protein product [Rotaria socialis]|uniref:Uncharacterized protein n=1 Tax=Rotaria socialis TaxID=392032 RepID=A0A821RYX8_9BILA|nr:unnamed protein product [Rotaria socialis]CAF3579263.1 unnamed protein product [Rotaria socialis]CAF4496969.1 unnamed protein product [Rotaria socialis]CAF4533978.1 unnamed protein product [Rotaria socialis]CAF4642080.1 unnamed protein product [Rotaria socialis]